MVLVNSVCDFKNLTLKNIVSQAPLIKATQGSQLYFANLIAMNCETKSDHGGTIYSENS